MKEVEKNNEVLEELDEVTEEVIEAAPEDEEEEKKKKKGFFWLLFHSKKGIIALVCVLLLLLGGVGGFLYYKQQNPDDVYLENAVRAELGQLDDKSDAEIEAELNRVIEMGSMAISINVNPVFPKGDAEGNLKIENSPANHYAQEVVITRDDTGEEIYRSGLLQPNYHIQNDVLSVVLEKGEYDCTATFTAYDMQTLNIVGMAAAKVKISVLT